MRTARRVPFARFRAGVLALASLSILSVLVYLLTGGTLFKPKAVLYTYVPDANGVELGAEVRVNGITVGKVRSLRLAEVNDPNRVVQIGMTVEEEVLLRVPDDSFSAISADNLLGDKFIDITQGRSLKHIGPDGEVRYQAPTQELKNLDLRQFEAKLRTMEALFVDIEQGKGPVGQFVMGEDLHRQVLNKVIGLEKGLTAAVSTTTPLGELMYRDTHHRQIREAVRQLDEKLAELEAGTGPAGKLLKDTADYDDIRAKVADIRRILDNLNAGRDGGEFLKKDDLYRQWNKRVASLIQAVDEINYGGGSLGPFLQNAQLYESLNGAMREMQSTVKDFRSDPKKYLRIKLF